MKVSDSLNQAPSGMGDTIYEPSAIEWDLSHLNTEEVKQEVIESHADIVLDESDKPDNDEKMDEVDSKMDNGDQEMADDTVDEANAKKVAGE